MTEQRISFRRELERKVKELEDAYDEATKTVHEHWKKAKPGDHYEVGRVKGALDIAGDMLKLYDYCESQKSKIQVVQAVDNGLKGKFQGVDPTPGGAA
jgi:hypothetical protein